MRAVLPMMAVLTGCFAMPAGPDAVVRDYFEAVRDERADVVRGHVASACQARPIAKGAPGKVLFVPVQFTRLDVSVVSTEADRALVAYEYEGTASGKQVDETVNVLGTEVDVKLDGVDVGSIRRSGQLELVKEGGEWKLGC